jgi:hypothetical protein
MTMLDRNPSSRGRVHGESDDAEPGCGVLGRSFTGTLVYGLLTALSGAMRGAKLPDTRPPFDLGWLFNATSTVMAAAGPKVLVISGLVSAMLLFTAYVKRGFRSGGRWKRSIVIVGDRVSMAVLAPVALGLIVWLGLVVGLWLFAGSWDHCIHSPQQCSGD